MFTLTSLNMFLLAIIVLLLITFLSLLYKKRNVGVLEGIGLKVNPSNPIFGNALDLLKYSVPFWDIQNFQKFGPIYGVYEGWEPQVHICDAKIIELIFTKDSDHFATRRRMDFRNKVLNEFVSFQPHSKWKLMRSALLRQLTPAKVKGLCEILITQMEDYSKSLEAKASKTQGSMIRKFDLRNNLFSILLDVFAKYYLNMDALDNEFKKVGMSLLDPANNYSPMMETAAMSFPFLAKHLPSFYKREKTESIAKYFLELIKKRKAESNKDDFLDFCNNLYLNLDSQDSKQNKISKYTIVSLMLTLFGGHHQITDVISKLIHFLLLCPEKESKLYQEVDDGLVKSGGKLKYENLHLFPYLYACLKETARLVPFLARIERVCTKDWENKEYNLTLKKGTVVRVPVWAANRNPKYCESPSDFVPERYLPENKDKLHPFSFTSFGFGPKSCIGYRVSFDVMMIVAISLLKVFKFHLRPDSAPEYIPAGSFFAINKPFFFDVSTRSD